LANTVLVAVLLIYTKDVLFIIYKIKTNESVCSTSVFIDRLYNDRSLHNYWVILFLATLGHSKFANNSVISSSIFHLCGLIFFGAYKQPYYLHSGRDAYNITEAVVCGIRLWGAYKIQIVQTCKTNELTTSSILN
jgi:hypothetical protein